MQFQKLKRTVFCALVVSGAMATVSQSQAAGYCSAGAATEGISAGNVTFNSISANDCYGVVSGNITGSGTYNGVPVLNAMNWGSGWTYFDSTDAPGGDLSGLKFMLTATPGSSGTWALTGVDNSTTLNFPATLDLVIGLKGGSEYALWGFDNVVLDGSDTGAFSIAFTNKGGKNPGLAHMIVFGRPGSVAAVPEAKTYVMLLAGLGLVGFAVRRRQA